MDAQGLEIVKRALRVRGCAALHPDRIAYLVNVDSVAPRIKDTLSRFDDFYHPLVYYGNIQI